MNLKMKLAAVAIGASFYFGAYLTTLSMNFDVGYLRTK